MAFLAAEPSLSSYQSRGTFSTPSGGSAVPMLSSARAVLCWRMDRALLQDHFTKAERHVIESEGHILRQKQLIAKLERSGHDATEAKRLLAEFQALLALHIADRDRLRAQLANPSD